MHVMRELKFENLRNELSAIVQGLIFLTGIRLNMRFATIDIR